MLVVLGLTAAPAAAPATERTYKLRSPAAVAGRQESRCCSSPVPKKGSPERPGHELLRASARGPLMHNVLSANAPRAVDSPLTRRGGRYAQTFTVPGTYNLFCDLHPMTMRHTVTMRP